MNSEQVRGLPVINIADGTQAGIADRVYLDLAAKHVVGFSHTDGVGPFGGGRDNAPTVAAAGVHFLGPSSLTLDDLTVARAAWDNGQYGALVSLDDLAGCQVVTEDAITIGTVVSVTFDERTFALSEVEISPGFLKTHTHIPLDQLIRIGQDVVVVADAVVAASESATVSA
jgi:uncharacterized protein YrrD